MSHNGNNWVVIRQSQHTMLSSVQPADALKPGPVIGAGSMVRECGRFGNGSRFDEICLDVRLPDGTVERGYTYANLVALPSPSRRIWLVPAVGIAGLVSALIAILV